MRKTTVIKAESAKKNFIFQILYQIIIFVIPLFTAPYLTRTLGDTSLGIYSYTNSIAYYFVLLAMLGISRHGQRVIAARRNEKDLLRRTFWSLYLLHSIASAVAILSYVTFLFFGEATYRTIYIIQIIYVLSALFDITWLFYGLENFRSVVIRNLLIKICECICIFCLIHTADDLWIYTLIMSSSACLGQAVMLPQAISFVKPIKISWNDIKEHIKPLFLLFIAVVASTLYTVFGKTMLGIMSTEENVAYYEYSNKIINIPKAIIGVIFTVLYPRACASMAKGDEANSRKYLDYSLHFTCLLGVGSVFGLLGVSNLFIVLYYGADFVACGDVIIALAPVIVVNEIGNIIRTQYMIPNHMDVWLNVSYLVNAIINIVLCVVLIPLIGIYGAVVGTVAAETAGLIFQSILCKKFLSLSKIILTTIPYIIFGAAMFGIIYLIRLYYNDGWLDLLFQAIVGGGVYCILCAIYLFYFSPIKKNVRGLLHFKKHRRTVATAAAGTENEDGSAEEQSDDRSERMEPSQKNDTARNADLPQTAEASQPVDLPQTDEASEPVPENAAQSGGAAEEEAGGAPDGKPQ